MISGRMNKCELVFKVKNPAPLSEERGFGLVFREAF
jgi:hypothetical protein